VNAEEVDALLTAIVQSFSIEYADFSGEAFAPYRARSIGGFVRFDERRIYFDRGLTSPEEERTWAHEALSIYYYEIQGVIGHDDEIEEEARALCDDDDVRSVLRRFIMMSKR
jgi:hypothetical protein